jgi:hypothetical protein
MREEWRVLLRNAGSIFFRTKAFLTREFPFCQASKQVKTLDQSTPGQLRLHTLTVSMIGGDNLILYKTLCIHLL